MNYPQIVTSDSKMKQKYSGGRMIESTQNAVGCNYLAMFQIPASGTNVLKYTTLINPGIS